METFRNKVFIVSDSFRTPLPWYLHRHTVSHSGAVILTLSFSLSLCVSPCVCVRVCVFRMEASCLELALEGERLCKAGDFKGGTAFFEAAVQVGTEDLKTLSAIYSQLGNAYFYLKEYGKALEYHRHDLTLAR